MPPLRLPPFRPPRLPRAVRLAVRYLTPFGAALPAAAGYNVHTHSDFGPWAEDTFRRMLIDRYNVPEAELSQKDLLLVNLWHPFGKAQRSSAGESARS